MGSRASFSTPILYLTINFHRWGDTWSNPVVLDEIGEFPSGILGSEV